MTRETCIALFLLGELFTALRANDPNLTRQWLSGGVQDLGEPVLVELLRSIERFRDCLDGLPADTSLNAMQQIRAGDVLVLVQSRDRLTVGVAIGGGLNRLTCLFGRVAFVPIWQGLHADQTQTVHPLSRQASRTEPTWADLVPVELMVPAVGPADPGLVADGWPGN